MSKKTPVPRAEDHMVVFQEKTIRRVWHNEQWWFAVVDVVAVLTDTLDARQYVKKMRSRDPQLEANWGTTCTPLPLLAPDGKLRATNCANTEGLFRIIQSIPSPKAEPFKRWLAQVGYERVKEIEDPELASTRATHCLMCSPGPVVKDSFTTGLGGEYSRKNNRVRICRRWQRVHLAKGQLSGNR